MRIRLTVLIVCAAIQFTQGAHASDDARNNIVVEFDPAAMAAAVNEARTNGFESNQFGITVDFPASPSLSTGPEFWGATYAARGQDSADASVRREDLFPGEKHRIEAFRLKWNLTSWENSAAMSGRYFQLSYAYTRINSRANRYTEAMDSASNLPTDTSGDSPSSETDLITDTRHGFGLELGNRWIAHGFAWSVGVGISRFVDRTVAIASTDDQALADYETSVNRLLNSRLSLAPVPELSFGVGFAF